MIEDVALLRRYVTDRSEDAFAELVRRRLNLVYSVALRQVGGDAHLAEDVTQKVFADLARKAHTLLDRPAVAGWLYRSAQYAASDVVRSERRRRAREQETSLMNELIGSEPVTDWDRLRPLLDEAMGELNDPDRDAIALRFFEGRAFADIGRALKLTEEAARKRVDRALDKLAAVLSRRGVTSTSVAVGAALTQQAAVAAPASLAASVTGSALAGAGVAAGWSVVSLLSSAKVSTTLGLAAVVAAGAVIYEANLARETAQRLVTALTAQQGAQGRIADLERRLQLSQQQAKAAEADNAQLLDAIKSVRTVGTPAASAALTANTAEGSSAGGPVTDEMVQSRYRHAQELARRGESETALREFLWCYDEGMTRVPNYAGLRGSFLLSEIAGLAKTFPAALTALRERRDQSERSALEDVTSVTAARDFANLNNVLGESGRTLDLYDRLGSDDPRRQSLATLDVVQLLIDAHRYNEAALAQPYDQMLSLFATMARPLDTSKLQDPERLMQIRRRSVVASAAKNVEVLAGAGDLPHARELAQKVLAYDGSAEARHTLQAHVVRAGQPDLLATIGR